MSTDITATFEVTSWDETEIDEHRGTGKLARASVTGELSGDIEGTSSTEWLMAYADDGSATTVGLQRIRGAVAGRKGSIVIQHVGGYADGAATAELNVVPGAGSGELVGVAGTGDFRADPKGTIRLTLDFGEPA
jgi:hypothetical protein